MSDRCINLRDWEAAAQPAASVVVRPVRRKFKHGAEFVMAPLVPGDTAILREKFSYLERDAIDWTGFPLGLPNVWYWADGDVPAGDWCRPLSPAVMPAELARWRRPVVSVEAVEIGKVSEEMWRAAGIPRSFLSHRRGGQLASATLETAEELWKRTYGPGSWSGWVWVVTMEVGA